MSAEMEKCLMKEMTLGEPSKISRLCQAKKEASELSPACKKMCVCVCVCVCARVCAQSCPTLCDPMDCSPPGSSVHGVFQARNTGVGCH